MSEIPEDILKTAAELVEMQSVWIRDKPHETCAKLIAEALMAERERCAKIAEAAGRELEPSFVADTAWAIAESIRSPDTDPST
ncbi:hypothetical protein [Mesorhizobium wenxiniae]|uniref:Uncharacterized protein n=1 Tax=Mesorhizobium wenxiniae TaxID=2014805 RepID=A0A271KE92_9HYPH|nr:hypothetical protein [Mesorhizobium wenxiniae]PAP94006.1 hypothetical protein CIT31_16705 [Mesorhizobium wenxiniae]